MTLKKTKVFTKKERSRDWRLFECSYELAKGRLSSVRVLAPNQTVALLGVPTLADEVVKIKIPGDEFFQRLFEPKTPQDTDLAGFMAFLTRAISKGYPTGDSLKTALVSVKSPVLRGIIAQMRLMLSTGDGAVADAMAQFPDVFEDAYCRMVRAAESTGGIGEMIGAIARTIIGKNKLKKMFIKKMAYPLVTASIGFLVILFLLFGALPTAVRPAIEAGREVWAISRIPYNFVIFMQERPYMWLVPVLIIAFFWMQWKVLIHSEFIQRKMVKIPKIGETIIAFGIVNPLRVLGMMQRAAIAASVRINTACESSGVLVVREFFKQVGQRVGTGVRLETAFALERWRIGDIGDDLAAQAVISAATGAADDILDDLAAKIEEEVESRIDKLVLFLAPVVIFTTLLGAVFAFASIYAVQIQELFRYLSPTK